MIPLTDCTYTVCTRQGCFLQLNFLWWSKLVWVVGMLFMSSGKLWADKHGLENFKVVMIEWDLEWTLHGISFGFVHTLLPLLSSYAPSTWRKFSLRPVWLSGRRALFLHLPPVAPVAGDLPCVHYSDSASSDPGLAVKDKFATKHLLMSSLFFMVYLVYHRPGTTWYLLSCLWSGTMYNLPLVFSFYMSFLIHYVTVAFGDVFEHSGAAWEWSITFLEGCFCWDCCWRLCSRACLVHVKSLLSRGQPQPQALMVLVLSIFVLLYICKVLSSDLLAVLVFNSP